MRAQSRRAGRGEGVSMMKGVETLAGARPHKHGRIVCSAVFCLSIDADQASHVVAALKDNHRCHAHDVAMSVSCCQHKAKRALAVDVVCSSCQV